MITLFISPIKVPSNSLYSQLQASRTRGKNAIMLMMSTHINNKEEETQRRNSGRN
jgi:hypothetical protein